MIMISLAVFAHSGPYGLLHRKLYSIIISGLNNLGNPGFASQELSLQSKRISANSQVTYIRTPGFRPASTYCCIFFSSLNSAAPHCEDYLQVNF